MAAKPVITCAYCGVTFQSTWTEEDAIAEATKVFGSPPPPGKSDMVCEDCYIKLMKLAAVQHWEKTW